MKSEATKRRDAKHSDKDNVFSRKPPVADWCPTLTQRQADKRQRQCGSASTGRALQAGAGGRRPPAAGRGGRDEAETISRWEPLGAAEPGPVKCRQKRSWRGTVSRQSCFSRCRELKSRNLRSLSQSRPPLPVPSPPLALLSPSFSWLPLVWP